MSPWTKIDWLARSCLSALEGGKSINHNQSSTLLQHRIYQTVQAHLLRFRAISHITPVVSWFRAKKRWTKGTRKIFNMADMTTMCMEIKLKKRSAFAYDITYTNWSIIVIYLGFGNYLEVSACFNKHKKTRKQQCSRVSVSKSSCWIPAHVWENWLCRPEE